MTETMSQTEYAEHRGCSQPNVSSAIACGRLTSKSVARDGVRYRIDPVAADLEWPRPAPYVAEEPPEAGRESLADIKRRQEATRASLLQMRAERMAGTLLDRGRVEKAVADAGVQFRTALEQLPSKLAPQLAAESDPARVRALLGVAVRETLTNLADNLREFAG